MKKFLIAGSSLAAVAAAGSAGAVDVTLGGSIDMGVEFGLGKDNGNLAIGDAYNKVTLSIAAAGTTDGGLKYGGSFSLGTSAEISIDPYATAGGVKHVFKKTVEGATDVEAAIYNVSGGKKVSAGDVVSVKINSSWIGIGGERTAYAVTLAPSFESDNICKVAGRGTAGSNIFKQTVGGKLVNPTGADGGGYLPAGRVATSNLLGNATAVSYINNGNAKGKTTVTFKAAAAASQYGNAGVVNLTAYNSANTAPIAVNISSKDFAGTTVTAVAKKSAGNVTVPLVRYNDKGSIKFAAKNTVTSAAIYAGPFMEVMLASSSTKMVIGAVCVEGQATSDTVLYMNNASKIMTVGAASIFIEGGFGKLTLQSGDYAGAVSAIAGAGDQADIDADGLVVIAEGVGMLGANPYVAVDLASGSQLGSLEVITGGHIEMGGLSAAIDIGLSTADIIGVTAWDLGLDYSLGDMAVSFATDSSSDWGLAASMAVAGFAVDAEFGSASAGDHEKSGIMYSVSAATSLNGFGLSIGVDQDLQPEVSLSYALGDLSVYAGYDAADEGGKVGAKLSF